MKTKKTKQKQFDRALLVTGVVAFFTALVAGVLLENVIVGIITYFGLLISTGVWGILEKIILK